MEERAWNLCQSLAAKKGPGYALFRGDARHVLSSMPEGLVDTCVTSPPYWGARDYGLPDQVGLEEELDDYVASIVSVMRGVRRVLRDEGTAWLNIGDVYFHRAGTVAGRPPIRGWKRNKQLTLVPFRIALALEEDGWWLRNTVVWRKPNAMPASVRDRLSNTWEPVFLFAKSEHYYFNLDAVRVPHRTDDSVERRRAERGNLNGKARGQLDLRKWLNSPRHRSTIEGLREIRRRPNAPDPTELARYLRAALSKKHKDIDWAARELGQPFERVRHYFRTDRIGSRLPPEDTWERLRELLDLGTDFDDAMQVEVGDNVFRNHPAGRNPGDVASYATASTAAAHYATMPVDLASWLLRATLPPRGICLDPFMGIGTSGAVALSQGGRFIGVDIDLEYLREFSNHLQTTLRKIRARYGPSEQLSLSP